MRAYKKMGNNFTLITSACENTAYEIATQLASDGCNLVLVGEDAETLLRRARQLKKKYNIEVVTMVKELGVTSAAAETYNDIDDMGICVDCLVNIAAATDNGHFINSYPERDTDCLQRSIVSFAAFTKYFLRGMLKRNRGTIYHVPPAEGMVTGTLSAAISAFITSFTTAVARETIHTNISIMCWLQFTAPVRSVDMAG